MGEVKLFGATLSSEQCESLLRSEFGGIGLGIGRYRGKVGAAHLSGQRNRLTVLGLWCRVMLVDCCGWVVNQDRVLYRNPLRNSSV